jgi:hypothetical protein
MDGLNSYFIEQFKKFAQTNLIQPGEQLTVSIDIVTGSLAGAIAGAITTPLDVMKTLLQTQSNNPADTNGKHYSGIMDGMKWNYKHQGVAGLFRGLGPRVFWTSSQSALMFVVYEQFLNIERKLREKDEWPPSKWMKEFI